MNEEYETQGTMQGFDGKVKKVHLVRVTLNDHQHKCLAQEAAKNYRVPSKELAHQVAERYKKKFGE